MSRFVVLGLIIAVALSACGQKGPLYLPDKNGSVITRPGTAPQNPSPATPAQTPKKKDDDSGASSAPK